MKAHIAQSKRIHRVVAASAKWYESSVLPQLLTVSAVEITDKQTNATCCARWQPSPPRCA